MKTVYMVKIRHTATGCVFNVPVLGIDRADAEQRARDWPYTTDAYEVVMEGEKE